MSAKHSPIQQNKAFLQPLLSFLTGSKDLVMTGSLKSAFRPFTPLSSGEHPLVCLISPTIVYTRAAPKGSTDKAHEIFGEWKEKGDISVELLRRWEDVNSQPRRISKKWFGGQAEVVERGKTEFLIQSSGWDRFHQKYPNSAGILEISAPSFSPDSSKVIYFARFSRDFFGPWGFDILAEKVGSKWTITRASLVFG